MDIKKRCSSPLASFPASTVSDAQGIIRHIHVDTGMPTAEILAEEIKNYLRYKQ